MSRTRQTRVPIQANKVDAKENFVTVYNSGDGTLKLSKEQARALGIGISSNEGKIISLWIIKLSSQIKNFVKSTSVKIELHSCTELSRSQIC